MKKILITICTAAAMLAAGCGKNAAGDGFIRIDGTDLVGPDGEKFLIRGTNLGNWLNPEGYMFGFSKTNSPSNIDLMLRQLAGPDYAAEFWARFKDNYITRADIDFIASTGANTIRLPFHYRLFTDEDYMGLTSAQDGFERIDTLVEWCREAGMRLILDMHDAPGGQTCDNIDDSYGYPWLFESEASQKLFCDIWRRIADRYKDEPVILGYDLLNEPIAPYFDNMEQINSRLAAIYKMGFDAVREADQNHIVMLGGAQWNGNFRPLENTVFDDKVMYTCHRYGGDPTPEAIRGFIEFRDRTGVPMYMGEIGHNSHEWHSAFCRTMEDNNIGWTFWPYKKMGGSSFISVEAPEGWRETIVAFAEAPRGTYNEVRAARPDQAEARRILDRFLENCRFENNRVETGYIESLGLKAQ